MRSIRSLQITAFVTFATGSILAASCLESGPAKPYDVGFVPSSRTLRWLSLGHPTLAANFLWLRAVQYIGEERADERGWDKLHPLVDAVTDLDPKHGYAYQVAGIVLGSKGFTEESSAILEKGTRNLPERYILPYLRAFNAFYYDDDWVAAGRFAEISARAPGAPTHVRQNVLAYYVKGRRADAAVAFLEQTLADTEDPESRKAVESQLRQARLEQAVRRLDEAVDTWRGHYFAGPLAPWQLVTEGLVASIPDDPTGGEFYIGEDGRIRSSANPYRVGRAERARDMNPEAWMKKAQRQEQRP